MNGRPSSPKLWPVRTTTTTKTVVHESLVMYSDHLLSFRLVTSILITWQIQIRKCVTHDKRCESIKAVARGTDPYP